MKKQVPPEKLFDWETVSSFVIDSLDDVVIF